MKEVYSMIEEPFTIEKSVFTNYVTTSWVPESFTSATLYVPAGTKAKYQTTYAWNQFASRIEEMGDTQDAVTLTGKNYTRQYGEENPTFDYTVTGGTITSGTPSITCSATKTSPVGTYPIVISKGTVSNSTVNLVNGTLTITKAPLTISAGNYTKVEGEANPTFTPAFSGFKNGETKSVLTKQPTVSTTATTSSPAGTYPVTVSGAEAQNYSITYVAGTLTVTPKGSTEAEPYAVFNNGTLTFYCDNQRSSREGTTYDLNKNYAYPGWNENTENITVAKFDASFANARPTSTYYWFANCKNMTEIQGLEYLNTSEVTNMSHMFSICSSLTNLDLSNFNTAKVTSMWDMFFSCKSLTSLNLSNFNTAKVTSMNGMFQNCYNLTSLNLSNFNTANVTSMRMMFDDCYNLTNLDVSNFNTANVTNMEYLFLGCRSLTNLDVSNFNTANVTSMRMMFDGCSSLTSLDVSNFNTANVTSLHCMFSSCRSLVSLDISNFNTANVTDMAGMFRNCSALSSINVSGFDTKKVTTMHYMFQGCSNLASLDLSGFDTRALVDINAGTYAIGDYSIDNFLYGCSKLSKLTLGSSFTTTEEHKCDYVFTGCSSLKTVTFTGDIPSSINSKFFTGVGTAAAPATLDVPEQFKSNYAAKFDGNQFFGGYFTLRGDTPDDGIITFADAEVKRVCVENWDTNGDGELSKAEAAAVTDLGEVFKNKSKITSFDELQYFTGLTAIGEDAFSDCRNLASVILPNTVTKIGSYAFISCEKLKTINLPNSVTEIGSCAFIWCDILDPLVIPSSVKTINYYAFRGCGSLKSLTIPSSVTYIGSGITSYCDALASIVVESGNPNYESRDNCNAIIVKTSNSLIAGCKNTVIPASVTSVGYDAFAGNKGLEAITIPAGVTSITEGAFAGCSSLATIKVESGNTVYDSRGNCNAIIVSATNELVAGCKNTIIPNTVTSLYKHAFYQCGELESITIPGSVKSIGANCFDNCTKLADITFCDGLETVGAAAFQSCNALTSVAFPNTLKTIEPWAFNACRYLASITIPASVTAIGEKAFYQIRNIKEVKCWIKEPFAITYDVFQESYSDDSSFTTATLYVPKGTKAKYEATDGWKNFKTIVEMGDTPDDGIITFADAEVKRICVANWDTDGDGELSKAEAASVTDIGTVFKNNKDITSFDEFQYFTNVTSVGDSAFYLCSNLKSIIIPDGVTAIKRDAFYSCSRMTAITLPSSLDSFGAYSFCFCRSLSSVSIPNSVKSIGTSAFNYCENLVSITIPKSVTSIGSHPLNGCSSLVSVIVESDNTNYDSRNGCNAIISTKTNVLLSGCKNTVIPNSVTAIGEFAFGGSKDLKSIIIPNSVTKIYSDAFYGCSSLSSVTLGSGLSYLANFAFSDCKGLIEVNSKIEEPFAINENVFRNSDNANGFTSATLYVPKGTKAKYEATDGWKNFKTIVEMDDKPKGDVNGDQNVDVADIGYVIDVMAEGSNNPAADVNGDGSVDVADIGAIIDEMAARARRLNAENGSADTE